MMEINKRNSKRDTAYTVGFFFLFYTEGWPVSVQSKRHRRGRREEETVFTPRPASKGRARSKRLKGNWARRTGPCTEKQPAAWKRWVVQRDEGVFGGVKQRHLSAQR